MTAAAVISRGVSHGKISLPREIRLRTETPPVSQAACDDYALPEIAGHIAHLANDKAKEQAENTIDQCD